MNFSQIRGNADVIAALVGMVDSGKVPHAMMFHEDDGGDGIALALAFLSYLYCRDRRNADSCGECPSCNKIAKFIHPDVHFVYPTASGSTSIQYAAKWRALLDGGLSFTREEFLDALGLAEKPVMIAVSEANSLLQTLSLSALEGGYRSVVVYLPEMMNQEASNKLLKLVEEPPAKTQFILVTHAPEKVLATISSRCQRIRIKPSGHREVSEGESAAVYREIFSSMLGNVLSRKLLKALEDGDAAAALPTRESAMAFCAFSVKVLREIFLRQQGLTALGSPDSIAESFAAGCPRTFPRKAMEAFDRASMLIGRNVNAKIIFTDLVDRLYTIK